MQEELGSSDTFIPEGGAGASAQLLEGRYFLSPHSYMYLNKGSL